MGRTNTNANMTPMPTTDVWEAAELEAAQHGLVAVDAVGVGVQLRRAYFRKLAEEAFLRQLLAFQFAASQVVATVFVAFYLLGMVIVAITSHDAFSAYMLIAGMGLVVCVMLGVSFCMEKTQERELRFAR